MTKEDEVDDNRQRRDKGSGSDGLACKTWPHGGSFFPNRKGRTLKRPCHFTLKTRKAGFHLEMAETVMLRRVQEEKKLLCVKGRACLRSDEEKRPVAGARAEDKSLLAAARPFLHLVLVDASPSEVQVGKLRLSEVTILPSYTLHTSVRQSPMQVLPLTLFLMPVCPLCHADALG